MAARTLAAAVVLASVAAAFAPRAAPQRSQRSLLRAVDYEAELYSSKALNADDASLAEWVEKWVRRAVLGEESGGATVRLTTPVKMERVDGATVKLIFAPKNTGFADKDKKKDDDDDWGAVAPKRSAPAPARGGEGGVALSVADGAIKARRCDYEGKAIVKQMSEEKIVTQLKKDVSAGFSR